MILTFEGTPEIAAPRQHVWRQLLDIEFVASCATGVATAEAVDDRRFRVTAILRLGIVRFRFIVNVEIDDLDAQRSARLMAHGRAAGSRAAVETRVTLDEITERRTQLYWHATAHLEGAIVLAGTRILTRAGRELIDDFWTEFAARAALAV